MSDQQSIHDLIARSAQELDDAQFHPDLHEALAGWASLFAEDAVVDLTAVKPASGVADDVLRLQKGREAIRSATARAIELRPSAWHPSKHVTFNPLVRLDGDTADASWDYFVVCPAIDGAAQFVITRAGRSYDRLVKRDDRWLFSARRVIPFVRT